MIICVVIIYVTTSDSVEVIWYICKFATSDTIEGNAQVYNTGNVWHAYSRP